MTGLRPFEAVIFDNDGLLLETEAAWTRAEVALFAGHGAEFTEEDKRTLLGSSRQTAEVLLERMLGQPGHGVALMDEMVALVMEELLQGVEPMPGAVAVVEAVRASGRPIAVATNSEQAFVTRALTVAGLIDHFDAIVSNADVEHGKPAPDVYLEACARLGIAPERCAGLEDSPTGAAALRAAGLFVIGVPSYPGVVLEDVDLLATSLLDPAVHDVLSIRL